VELGRIGVAYEVQLIASFSCAARIGHMELFSESSST
jgi:hypothetical protein